ncbi:MAG: hypothetical protein NTW07_07170 [candidate division Zixibacteria bacterium]|nr:hypothetical protein [candidate division Zixibacteria bacterium]
MDVFDEQVIDIGLTVIGYLAAAGLGMLLYSVMAGRRRSAPTPIEAQEVVTGSRRSEAACGVDVQYVDLRARQSSALPSRVQSVSHKPTIGVESRRDRPEIIRLARQMLKAGTPAEMVRRTLPISDAELALLQSAIAQ